MWHDINIFLWLFIVAMPSIVCAILLTIVLCILLFGDRRDCDERISCLRGYNVNPPPTYARPSVPHGPTVPQPRPTRGKQNEEVHDATNKS